MLDLLGGDPDPNLSAAAAVDRIISVAEPTLAVGMEVAAPSGCVVRPASAVDRAGG